MSQTPDQIESAIDKTRATLHANVQELEDKVKSVTDWKQLFANHPGAMAAAAFGIGALVATLIGNRKSGSEGTQAFTPATVAQNGHDKASRPKPQALQTWDNIKNAMVGVAASKVTGFLGELLPGFEEEFRKRGRDHDRSSATSAGSAQHPIM